MDRLAALWDRIGALWTGLPPMPDPDLPVPGDPALLIVGATILGALGLMGLTTGWVDGRLARLPFLSTLAAAALFFWVWDADRDDFRAMSVPVAFVEMAARVIR